MSASQSPAGPDPKRTLVDQASGGSRLRLLLAAGLALLALTLCVARSLRIDPGPLTVVTTGPVAVQRSLDFDRGIRPFVVAHDERRMFAQLSEFHGVAEIDLASPWRRVRF